MKRKRILLALLVLALSISAFAQSVDNLYERAVNKFFLGDNDGAIELLNRVLDEDPGNARAKALLNEIREETKPAPAPARPAPAPQPRPEPPVQQVQPGQPIYILPYVPQPAPAPSPTRPREPRIEEKAPSPPQHIFVPQMSPAARDTTGELVQQIALWMTIISILIILLIFRLVFSNIRDFYEKKRLQVCPECKWSNPGLSEFCSKCGARLKPWVGITAAQRKWYAKFGWRRNPFTLDIIPNLFTGYRTQVDRIFEKVQSHTGHILIMGNKGVGKTTLLKWLSENLRENFHAVYVPRPTDNFDDLLEFLAESLKIKKQKGQRFTVYDLEAFASHTQKPVLILLDEASELTQDFERPLRTLGDLNGINIILAGLLETKDRIKQVSPPFLDRIVLEVTLEHLTQEETRDLMLKRIEDAGGQNIAPFTPEAVENVYKMSAGVPRKILKVCDWIITEAIHSNLDQVGSSATEGYQQEEN